MPIKIIIERGEDGFGRPSREVKTFSGTIVTIGADPACTLPLNDPAAAPEQAVLIAEKSRWLLINKAAGTTLNGEPLAREARRPLLAGALLRVGGHAMSFDFNDKSPDKEARHTEKATGRAGVDGEPHQDAPPASGDGARSAVPPLPPAPPATPAAPPRNFAKVLESLRTIEDSFHFVVEGGERPGRRVTIDTTTMLVGWDEAGRDISFEAGAIATPRAVVRKEWRGVFVQPVGREGVAVNDEAVETERLLHDGDHLKLLSQTPPHDGGPPYLIFHVPATLHALDSLSKPQAAATAPPPEATAGDEGGGGLPGATRPARSPPRPADWFTPGRKYFRHFTPLDLLLMCVGTLMVAGIFFLILIYLKPVR